MLLFVLYSLRATVVLCGKIDFEIEFTVRQCQCCPAAVVIHVALAIYCKLDTSDNLQIHYRAGTPCTLPDVAAAARGGQRKMAIIFF